MSKVRQYRTSIAGHTEKRTCTNQEHSRTPQTQTIETRKKKRPHQESNPFPDDKKDSLTMSDYPFNQEASKSILAPW